jgi:hypothetical protein
VDQVNQYFNLFTTTKAKYKICDDNIYNMDEKRVMIGILAKLKVVCSWRNAKAHITQPGNREWVSLIECICSDGTTLSAWVIFKENDSALNGLESIFRQVTSIHRKEDGQTMSFA